ncbi:type VI secretion system contractile sheath large subunit [Gallaecimonas kandeliae]|uniref:type VI secretion system contractile sheath large subunit n=1 Tax=Gallaecimonas kandeliae TaxID=3029055 RepID=UPI002648002E|nr:type VI secretion system contractile sheath large subunit [Gallaecimonas kandeliae]WKE65739.1 type VI secretion system contractile sheath large subunit [Gallaecimonas kandeliae]
MSAALQFVAKDYFATPEARPALPDLAFMKRVSAEHDALQALLLWLGRVDPAKRWRQQGVKALLATSLNLLDDLLNEQLNAILHQSDFQALEANWRGLWLLTEQAAQDDGDDQVKVKVLDLDWQELSKDLHKAMEFDQSRLFAKIYSDEFGTPGGEPFGLLLGAYAVSHRNQGGVTNLDSLKELSRVAAAAFAPLILNADPSLFGVDSFQDLTGVRELESHFNAPELAKWRSLRDMEEARFLGLALPGILMRPPYRERGQGPEGFRFREHQEREADHLWGPACFGVGTVAIRAFCQSGWFSQIRGYRAGQVAHGVIDNLPALSAVTGGFHPGRSPVNWQVTDRMEKILADEGFLPLLPLANTGMLLMPSVPSVQRPARYQEAGAQISARLSAMLHYTLCVSRFAHYLKVMGRDRVGGYRTPQECESQLQRWLHGYTMASEGATDEMRSRFPLREARVQVKERAGEPGRYYSVIRLQPHFQLDQMVTGVKLVTELTPAQGA